MGSRRKRQTHQTAVDAARLNRRAVHRGFPSAAVDQRQTEHRLFATFCRAAEGISLPDHVRHRGFPQLRQIVRQRLSIHQDQLRGVDPNRLGHPGKIQPDPVRAAVQGIQEIFAGSGGIIGNVVAVLPEILPGGGQQAQPTGAFGGHFHPDTGHQHPLGKLRRIKDQLHPQIRPGDGEGFGGIGGAVDPFSQPRQKVPGQAFGLRAFFPGGKPAPGEVQRRLQRGVPGSRDPFVVEIAEAQPEAVFVNAVGFVFPDLRIKVGTQFLAPLGDDIFHTQHGVGKQVRALEADTVARLAVAEAAGQLQKLRHAGGIVNGQAVIVLHQRIAVADGDIGLVDPVQAFILPPDPGHCLPGAVVVHTFLRKFPGGKFEKRIYI